MLERAEPGSLRIENEGPSNPCEENSENHPDGLGGLDLYLSTRNEDGSWSEPINLGAPLNTPDDDRYGQLSPDGKYLFFGSDRGGNMDVYWVSARVLETSR